MDDKVLVNCPGCMAAFKAPSQYVGKNVRCPKCQTVFLIAPPEEEAPLEEVQEEPVEEQPAEEDSEATMVDPKRPAGKNFPQRRPLTQSRTGAQKQTGFQRKGTSQSGTSSQRLARKSSTSKFSRRGTQEGEEEDAPPKKGGSKLLIILLIIVILGGVTAGIYFGFINKPKPTKTGTNDIKPDKSPKAVFTEFMKATASEDVDKCKSFMSDQVSKWFEGLDETARKNMVSNWKKIANNYKITDENIDGNKAKVTYEFTLDGKKKEWKCSMVIQDGKWKIDPRPPSTTE